MTESVSPSRGDPVAVAPGVIVLFVSAVLMIVGSVGEWLTLTVGPISVSAAGTNRFVSQAYGLNGWVTFALGLVLLVLAATLTLTNERSVRPLALLVAFVSLGFCIYFFARVAHDVARVHPAPYTTPGSGLQMGWGVILLAVAGLGAFTGAVQGSRRWNRRDVQSHLH